MSAGSRTNAEATSVAVGRAALSARRSNQSRTRSQMTFQTAPNGPPTSTGTSFARTSAFKPTNGDRRSDRAPNGSPRAVASKYRSMFARSAGNASAKLSASASRRSVTAKRSSESEDSSEEDRFPRSTTSYAKPSSGDPIAANRMGRPFALTRPSIHRNVGDIPT